ncbi:MAG: tRNA (adenosine(37)-N6)-dimethylallyltransferase MiaA [Acidiferrobacterales bacterium]|nr:tRNA (adenosine(37)-N6)-dimethylallyltransferase MiaA [Acidiferrobacterales bacterium]
MAGSNVVSSFGDLDAADIPVICLMGTTATGKTDAAAKLYESMECEIISVDSSLVYTGMDIGTAKPDTEFLENYPHHLVDIRSPNDTYSVAEFYQDASCIIANATAKGKVAVLVGGTMFYYNVLEKGISELPAANSELRAEIAGEAAKDGWPALHSRLKILDPARAESIDKNDAQRIQRALEIVLESGQSVAALTTNNRPPISNRLIKIALTFSDRKYLHQRIEQRFDIMLEQGLQKEVEQLLADGVDPNCTAMKMIGYRQMLEFLQDDISYQEMRLKGIAATRQLAKRQLTWLRNQANVIWWVDFGLKDKKFDKLVEYVTQI